MSNYAKIRKMDISNGPGVRVSLFVQGCPIHCPGCFNKETWNPDAGEPFTPEVKQKLLDLCSPDYIEGLSILGGEPLWEGHGLQIAAEVAAAFKQRFPEKNLWVWTGFEWDEVKDLPIMEYIDVVVAGPFVQELADPTLKWRGSSNQAVIDVKQMRENIKILTNSEK